MNLPVPWVLYSSGSSDPHCKELVSYFQFTFLYFALSANRSSRAFLWYS